MAGKACHAFGTTTQFGLTQALGATQTMSQSVKPILVIASLLLSGCTPAGTASEVVDTTGLFGSEHEAAAAGSLNRPPPKTIALLAPGDSVTVLSDTYGKDYWACKVRTKDSVSGWVLCTSLDYPRGSGA